MIDKATVQRILDAADIVEVVSDYVHLVRRGSNYMGLCPFHNEKTPSFSVNRARNICHCFSCGKGGSPVNFIMEKEGINYHDALLHLAAKYGIKVEERQLTDKERALQSERESMMIVNEWAMNEMQRNLLSCEEGRNVGLQYLYQRGVTDEAIKAFRLGYAIDKSADLYDKAMRAGYELSVLQSVGLCGISQQSSRPYDRFRGRVIFPFMNSAGKVIAFGGRGIKGEPAKYINSPESRLYVKSNELYGIYQARSEIVRQNKCFLVEGYMDVIGMWQAGFRNVVASSGTSLTDGQIALIHRFTENVTLIYDGDAAGIKASMRGIDLLLAQKLNIKVLLLPDGDDPDSFARKHTSEEFQKYIEENERDFIGFKTDILLRDVDGPMQKAQAVKSIVRSIASVSDMIQRTIFIQQCALRLDMSEQILLTEVNKARGEVMEELRKRRELNRLERERRENPQPPVSVDNASQRPAAQEQPAQEEIVSREDVARLATPKDGKERLLRPLEESLAAYCVKYGLVDFCSFIDDEGLTQYLSVFEFIREELDADAVEITTPLVRKVFACMESLAEEYEMASRDSLAQIEKDLDEKRNQWRASISSRYMSVEDLANREEEFEKELSLERAVRTRELAMDFTTRKLCSYADDEIRNFALKTVTPRYKLSRYHSKQKKILAEQDKLDELVPRAVSELKDGLLCLRFKEVQTLLGNAVAAGDSAAVEEYMKQLQQITALRASIAKTIGERILSPRR